MYSLKKCFGTKFSQMDSFELHPKKGDTFGTKLAVPSYNASSDLVFAKTTSANIPISTMCLVLNRGRFALIAPKDGRIWMW